MRRSARGRVKVENDKEGIQVDLKSFKVRVDFSELETVNRLLRESIELLEQLEAKFNQLSDAQIDNFADRLEVVAEKIPKN